MLATAVFSKSYERRGRSSSCSAERDRRCPPLGLWIRCCLDVTSQTPGLHGAYRPAMRTLRGSVLSPGSVDSEQRRRAANAFCVDAAIVFMRTVAVFRRLAIMWPANPTGRVPRCIRHRKTRIMCVGRGILRVAERMSFEFMFVPGLTNAAARLM